MTDLIPSEDLKRLTDIGFIALTNQLTDHATAIFEAVRALRPEAEAGFLGLGMIEILKGDPIAAAKTLQGAPRTEAVKTFLGIALIQSSDVAQGEALLQSVLETGEENSPFMRIASDTLGSLKAEVA